MPLGFLIFVSIFFLVCTLVLLVVSRDKAVISFMFFLIGASHLTLFGVLPYKIDKEVFFPIETVVYANGKSQQVAFDGEKRIEITGIQRISFNGRKRIEITGIYTFPKDASLKITYWSGWKLHMYDNVFSGETYSISMPDIDK